MADIVLATPHGEYEGWESVRVSLALDQMTGSFELGVSGENAKELVKHPLVKGLQCRVLLGGQTVITGYINRRKPAFDANNHTLTISGRDVTCDLVDCSAIVPNQELHNATIKQAALALIKPFPAISLLCPDPGEPFDKFVINDGETIFDVLQTHARQRGLMVYTLGDGVLHIGRPGVTPLDVVLAEGKELKAASADESDDEQFAEYIVRAQDSVNSQHRNEQRYTDSAVRAGRVRIIQSEKPDGTRKIINRAEWEAKLRKARGLSVNTTVQGWAYKARGQLWRLGQAPKVHSPSLGLNQRSLVINGLTYSVNNEGGTITEQVLVPPEVYVYA